MYDPSGMLVALAAMDLPSKTLQELVRVVQKPAAVLDAESRSAAMLAAFEGEGFEALAQRFQASLCPEEASKERESELRAELQQRMKTERTAKVSSWKCVFTGSCVVREKKDLRSAEICEKVEGTEFEAYQEGDWLRLIGEPGYMFIPNTNDLHRNAIVPIHTKVDTLFN